MGGAAVSPSRIETPLTVFQGPMKFRPATPIGFSAERSMATHTADSSFPLPDLTGAPVRPGECHAETGSGRIDNGLGALRGLAFALIFEAMLGIAGLSAWHCWRAFR